MVSATEGENGTGRTVRLAEVLCPVVQEIRAQGARVDVQGTCGTYSGLDAEVVPLLRRAFREILDNAREAIEGRPAGEIRVAAGMARGFLRIRFADTGRGLPCSDPAEAFAPFFTTKPGHLGLGLALCQAALKALGGTVAVTSTGERGTEIAVDLPCPCRRSAGAERPRPCSRRTVARA